MKTIICKNYDEISKVASKLICDEVNKKPDITLGLATGSTPLGTYKEIINLYNEGKVDFNKVKTFNLDEYYNLPKSNEQSYDYFMKENFFNHINIDLNNTNIPNGLASDIETECKEYDLSILNNGGIDLQILGIGANAHIAFNEPSDTFKIGTSLVDLTQSTIQANSRFFEKIEDVPTQAISMGIGSIFKAKKIILIASGKSKAEAIYKTLNEDINPQVPSSILQLHNDVTLILDEDSASMLQSK